MKEFGENIGIACIILALCFGLSTCTYVDSITETHKVERQLLKQKIKKENP